MYKTVVGKANPEGCEIVYSNERFRYRIHPDHAKNIPNDMKSIMIAGGCCDRFDNLYLGSRDLNHPIIVLNPDGEYVKSIGKGVIKSMHYMCATPRDTLIVMDAWTQCAREIDMEGNELFVFGNENKPSDSGLSPRYWYDLRSAGELIPSEYGLDDHWAFIFAREKIHEGAPALPFNKPTDVKMNSKGEYFFSDGYGNVAVHKFDANRNYVKTWGYRGHREDRKPGEIICPHSLAVDKNDNVWVGDREGDCLHVYDGDGNLLAHISEGFNQPSGMWADDEYVYAIGRGGTLGIFDLEFNVAAQIGCFNSDLRAHDLCGNSRGDLFLFPTNANFDHQVIRLERLK